MSEGFNINTEYLVVNLLVTFGYLLPVGHPGVLPDEVARGGGLDRVRGQDRDRSVPPTRSAY